MNNPGLSSAMEAGKKRLAILHFFISLSLCLIPLGLGKVSLQAELHQALPQSREAGILEQAERAFFASRRSEAIVSVTGGQALEVTGALAEQFRAWGWLAENQNDFIAAAKDFYRPLAGGLLSDTYRQALAAQTNPGAIGLERLARVADPFVAETLDIDLTLNTAIFLDERVSSLSPLQSDGEYLYLAGSAGGSLQPVYFLFLRLPEQALGLNQVVHSAQRIKTAIRQTQELLQGTQVRHSGVLFHTAENTARGKQEMTFLGGLSLVTVMLLVFLAYRSAGPLWLALLTITHAALYGFAAVFWLFNDVHVLSLVFAVTLIGIAIDYCFHVFADLNRPEGKQRTLSAGVKRALSWSFVTTALGYLLLLFTPVMLLAQVAVFVAFGLAGAWVFSQFIHPYVRLPRPIEPTRRVTSLIVAVRRLFCRMQLRKRLAISTLLGAIVLSWAIEPIGFNDNVGILSASSPGLLESEAVHLEYLSGGNSIRAFVTAPDWETLLQREEAITQTAQDLNAESRTNALSRWLPSFAKREENNALLQSAIEGGKFSQLTAAIGQSVSAGKVTASTPDRYLESELAAHLPDYAVQVGGVWVSWLQIKGLNHIEQKQLFERHAAYLSQFSLAEVFTSVLSQFRGQLLQVLFGIAAVLILALWWRFGWQTSLLSAAILLIIVSGALQMSQWLLGSLNIFNVLGVLLILALAIDYLFFYQAEGYSVTNMLAIMLSAVSSACVFGMLAFSQTPAVGSFGLTVMLGILGIYFLAPLSLNTEARKNCD